MWKNLGKSTLWGVTYIWASFIGVMVAIIGFVVENLPLLQEHSDESTDLLLNEALSSIILGTCIASAICIVVYIIYKLICKHPMEINRVKFNYATFCLSLGIAFNMVITFFLDFIWSLLPEQIAQSALEATSEPNIESYSLLFMFISIGIIIPIGEEIIFRHGVCRVLSRSNRMAGILVSAILFGFAHGNLIQGLYTSVLGVLCALIILNTDNIWYPALVHIGLNATTVIMNAFDENKAYLILGFAGTIGLIICVTMLIHKSDIRGFFKVRQSDIDSTLNCILTDNGSDIAVDSDFYNV